MSSRGDVTQKRKRDHLEPFRTGGVSARSATTWLEHVRLIHCALPELNAASVDLSTVFAGHKFEAPLFITGMTGGTDEARDINRAIAKAAEKFGLAFGLGSQRAMLENPKLADTYTVRDVAPDVFLVGNLGGVQAVSTPVNKIKAMLKDVEASALCIHLNPSQELMQPEGDRDFSGVLDAIANLVEQLDVPVIVKETGAGISRETGLQLKERGVKYLDVSGLGGTSWVGVEVKRREGEANPDLAAFWDWGVPTAAAISDLADSGLELVGSGGIRTGLDAARAIALGAKMAGTASPIIQAYFNAGESGVKTALDSILAGIRAAMVLTGSRNLTDLRKTPRIITGPLLEWTVQRKA
ncbi:MAG: type 2 isopentenyl-diphosphate Delta-isomerase [Myxococcales bacterium]|nr:MAG: type 2 isopentenyl-diphosphate Delta-isomerase [Myxococcales bacterium]